MARDSLRATLDELKVDERSSADRPYLEAMLRRLGYTEKEIREELGPVVEPAPTLPQDFGTDGGVAPAREYRLVIPARESAFSFADPDAAPGPNSPFEDFERVAFEENAPVEETVEFTEVQPEPEVLEFVEAPIVEEPAVTPLEEAPEEAPLEFQEEAPLQEFQVVDEVVEPVEEPAVTPVEPVEEPIEAPLEEFQQAPTQEFQETPVESFVPEPQMQVEDVPIDTFGGSDVDMKPKTRVRVKRVRARSKAEAEAKVSSANRKVIKSIPVDIVERWGPGERGGKK